MLTMAVHRRRLCGVKDIASTLAESIARAHGLSAEVNYIDGYPRPSTIHGKPPSLAGGIAW